MNLNELMDGLNCEVLIRPYDGRCEAIIEIYGDGPRTGTPYEIGRTIDKNRTYRATGATAEAALEKAMFELKDGEAKRGTFAVQWANGRVDVVGPYQAAIDAIKRDYPHAAIGHDSDLTDGGNDTLFWESEEIANADDGQRAIGKIVKFTPSSEWRKP